MWEGCRQLGWRGLGTGVRALWSHPILLVLSSSHLKVIARFQQRKGMLRRVLEAASGSNMEDGWEMEALERA